MVSVVVVLIQNIFIREGGRDRRLEDFHGWLSLSNTNAVTKIRKISWVLEQKYHGSFENLCWKKDGEDQLDRSGEKTKYCTEPRRRGISYLRYNDGRLTGLVTCCLGNGF